MFRNIRRSALYDRLKTDGAVFGAKSGWERSNWFLNPNQKADEGYSFRPQGWWENWKAEVIYINNLLPPFSKIFTNQKKVAKEKLIRSIIP